ncbi:hypothetical protein DUI87_03279 [Hirundo rustica rustica]|uniref:Uncharacterized protein n=1 Tax=Hirundo rustica rustica TaxID=333673 RepID=A0A3M0L2P4_HIRRU|nr:hypothetical protein DUI87_03279 [Hirundo rustica rustica]
MKAMFLTIFAKSGEQQWVASKSQPKSNKEIFKIQYKPSGAFHVIFVLSGSFQNPLNSSTDWRSQSPIDCIRPSVLGSVKRKGTSSNVITSRKLRE